MDLLLILAVVVALLAGALMVALGYYRTEARVLLADLTAIERERDQASPLQGSMIGKRVIVTDKTDRTGYVGICSATYADCIVLDHAAEHKKAPSGAVESVAVPGEVVIPTHTIRVVQVAKTDDD